MSALALPRSTHALSRVCVAVFLSGLVTVLCPASSSAQTVINSVPYTIDKSGKYVLGGNLNLATTGVPAIYIAASNVILDLNGFYVSGVPNTLNSSVAVINVSNVSNVTIRNGTVANSGFGVTFLGGSNALNYLVENVNCTRCYFKGVRMYSAAPGSVVRRCRFSQIGGTTAYDISPIAISTSGGVRIVNNAISTVTPSSSGSTGCGIVSEGADLATGNTIYNAGIGIAMTAVGKFLDNLTSSCATPFSGGVNAIGNN